MQAGHVLLNVYLDHYFLCIHKLFFHVKRSNHQAVSIGSRVSVTACERNILLIVPEANELTASVTVS